MGLRYMSGSGLWALYWRDRNARFRRYDTIGTTAAVEDLLTELERDPTGAFRG